MTLPFGEPFGVGLSWSNGGETVDLDLQAVVVDTMGVVTDAAYFNQLSACHGAIVHAGDSKNGEMSGYDEMIWVKTQSLPAHVQLLIFVVGIKTEGSLMDVDDGVLTLFGKRGAVEKVSLERSSGSVDIVAAMSKGTGGQWIFLRIDEIAERGHNFADILEPAIGDVIRRHIPGAPERVCAAFHLNMRRDTKKVPLAWLHKQFSVAIGWDFMAGARYGRGVNMDLSAVFFSSDGHELGSVNCKEVEGFGSVHSGDNTTGIGAGNDESIHVNIASVPQEVEQIFFVVNVRTPGYTLSMVHNGFCRVVGDGKSELARHDFLYEECKPTKIFARVFRGTNSRWIFQDTAQYCQGRNWMSSVQTMRELFHQRPRELEAHPTETAKVRVAASGPGRRVPAQCPDGPPSARRRAAMIRRNLQLQAACQAEGGRTIMSL